jgi:hypothetical protein
MRRLVALYLDDVLISVAHEARILADGLGLTRIERYRNCLAVLVTVSTILARSRRSREFSRGLASSRLSGERSGCYGPAVVVSGGRGAMIGKWRRVVQTLNFEFIDDVCDSELTRRAPQFPALNPHH